MYFLNAILKFMLCLVFLLFLHTCVYILHILYLSSATTTDHHFFFFVSSSRLISLFVITKVEIHVSFFVSRTELYPTEVRGVGLGFSAYIGGIGICCIPLINYLVSVSSQDGDVSFLCVVLRTVNESLPCLYTNI